MTEEQLKKLPKWAQEEFKGLQNTNKRLLDELIIYKGENKNSDIFYTIGPRTVSSDLNIPSDSKLYFKFGDTEESRDYMIVYKTRYIDNSGARDVLSVRTMHGSLKINVDTSNNVYLETK